MSQRLDTPAERHPTTALDPVPAYLLSHYWWAYIHPNAVRLFERAWLVDLILWHNYRRLSEAALDALSGADQTGGLPGRTLQIACVYGDLTARLSARAGAANGHIDVVDVLPIQLDNLARKLPPGAPVRLLARNAADLLLPDASYDRALLFFLLHEQPDDVRRRTLREALRVVRPGGTLVIVDYARPGVWHPLRYLWLPVLRVLEPFARDLWRRDLAGWLPEPWSRRALNRGSFFGGLYQLVAITR
jgi:ubiquinone/menaquinone biosynthesis C-methylase UbiE